MPPAASAEDLSLSEMELTGPREIGNLTPLQLFEFIQIAMQLDTALSLILETLLVKNNLNLARNRNDQRLPPQVFC